MQVCLIGLEPSIKVQLDPHLGLIWAQTNLFRIGGLEWFLSIKALKKFKIGWDVNPWQKWETWDATIMPKLKIKNLIIYIYSIIKVQCVCQYFSPKMLYQYL